MSQHHPTLQRLWPSPSMGWSAAPPTHGTTAPYGPMQGMHHRVRRCRCWFPCLGHQQKPHWIIEREVGPWPTVAAVWSGSVRGRYLIWLADWGMCRWQLLCLWLSPWDSQERQGGEGKKVPMWILFTLNLCWRFLLPGIYAVRILWSGEQRRKDCWGSAS